MRALGEAVAHLPWLCPCAASLLAMAKAPSATAWSQLRGDPGAVLLALRHSNVALGDALSLPAMLEDPAILDRALHLLESPPNNQDCSDGTYQSARASAFADWSLPSLEPIYRTGLMIASLAEDIAGLIGRGDGELAWSAGLLTPLGWFAVAAITPDLASRCLADPGLPADPVATQQRHWGLDHWSIARRVCRQWQLPGWLSAIVGNLALPAGLAQQVGAEPEMLRVVQLAVTLAQQREPALSLPGCEPAEALGNAL